MMPNEKMNYLDSKFNIRHVDVFLCIYIVTLLAFKGGIAAMLCAGAFILFVFSAFITICTGRHEAAAVVNDHYAWCLVLFWIFAWTSYLWASSPLFVFDSALLKRAIQIIVSTILLLAVSKVRKGYGKTLLFVFTIATFISVVILLVRVPISAWGDERLGADAMGISSNALGILLSLACCSCLCFVARAKNLLWLLPAIIFYVVIVFTGTRQAMLVPFLYVAVRLALDVKKIKTLLYIVLLLLAIAALYQYLVTDQTMRTIVGGRLEQLVASITGSGSYSEHSIIERGNFRVWAMGLFLSSPIVGIGLNGFAGWLAASSYPNITTSHCNFTEILSGLGVFGFILFYLPYVLVLLRSFAARETAPDAKAIISIAVTMLVAQYAGEVYSNIAYCIFFAGIYMATTELCHKEARVNDCVQRGVSIG